MNTTSKITYIDIFISYNIKLDQRKWFLTKVELPTDKGKRVTYLYKKGQIRNKVTGVYQPRHAWAKFCLDFKHNIPLKYQKFWVCINSFPWFVWRCEENNLYWKIGHGNNAFMHMSAMWCCMFFMVLVRQKWQKLVS